MTAKPQITKLRDLYDWPNLSQGQLLTVDTQGVPIAADIPPDSFDALSDVPHNTNGVWTRQVDGSYVWTPLNAFETPAGATAKDTAAIATHSADTTDVHGITDTSKVLIADSLIEVLGFNVLPPAGYSSSNRIISVFSPNDPAHVPMTVRSTDADNLPPSWIYDLSGAGLAGGLGRWGFIQFHSNSAPGPAAGMPIVSFYGISAAGIAIDTIIGAGDSFSAWRLLGDGRMEWGSGGASREIFLYRESVGVMRMDAASFKIGTQPVVLDNDARLTNSRAPSWAVLPETFGAIGNGVNDDSDAVQAALNTGKTVYLTGGKTYLCRKQLLFKATGQVLEGNGAILKRSAQFSGTTTTVVTNGVTSTIVLQGGTNPFVVGDNIALSQGGSTGDHTYSRNIISIVGQTITVNAPFDVSFTGTTNVYLAGNQIYVDNIYDNCNIRNLILDGNKASWTLTNWKLGGGIYVGSNKNMLVEHTYLVNSVGDALQTQDATNACFNFCYVKDCAGRGFSFGGSGSDYGTKVLYCRFNNCETNPNAYLSGTAGNDGHGCINFSLGGHDALIQGCTIDTGLVGIGALGASANSGVMIKNNIIRNMTLYAVEGIGKNFGTPATEVSIEGNRFYNSVRVYLNQSASFPNVALEWTLKNNYFFETDCFINNYQQVDVSGNSFTTAGITLTLLTLSNAGGTVGVQRSTINGNRFYGGLIGISATQYDSGLVIADNVLHNQKNAHIQASTAGPDVNIHGNTITGGANSTNNGTNGIEVNGPCTVRDNEIDFVGFACNTGIRVNSSSVKARVINNTVLVPAANNSMQVIAGATDVELRDNTCNTTYFDAGTRTIRLGNRINNAQPICGTATLVAGTVTVLTAEALTGDNIIISRQTLGASPGHLGYTISNKTSITVTSSSAGDTGTFYWEIRH